MNYPCDVYGVCPYNAQDGAACAYWCSDYDESYSNENDYDYDEED